MVKEEGGQMLCCGFAFSFCVHACMHVCMCVCVNRCPTVKYLYPPASQMPVLLTELTLLLLNRLTDSLNSCASLCAPVLALNRSCTLQLKINHKNGTCSTEMPASVKKGPLFVCLSVRLSVCFIRLFVMGAGGKGEENGWLSAVNHKWVEECVCALERLSVIAPATCHMSVSSFVFSLKELLFSFPITTFPKCWFMKRSHFVGLIA